VKPIERMTRTPCAMVVPMKLTLLWSFNLGGSSPVDEETLFPFKNEKKRRRRWTGMKLNKPRRERSQATVRGTFDLKNTKRSSCTHPLPKCGCRLVLFELPEQCDGVRCACRIAMGFNRAPLGNLDLQRALSEARVERIGDEVLRSLQR